MRIAMKMVLLILSALLLAPLDATAQQPVPQPEPARLRPLRVAKWALLGGGGAAALYGLQQNQRADDAYEQLELLCLESPQRCAARTDAGTYVHEDFEAQYQIVRQHDSRARTSLIAGQLGVAASAVLFIIDLRNSRPPGNIPFEPSRIEVGLARDGGIRAGVRF